jgi:response regulator RpfG family c-di-GMP phosphodiesterase
MDELRLHALMAMKVVESFEWLKPTIPMIRHHHERWDGSGYPDGMKGDEIPMGARIIGVAEAFDTMVASLGWRRGMSNFEAINELRRCAGSQFDPKVVEAFAEIQPLIQPIED